MQSFFNISLIIYTFVILPSFFITPDSSPFRAPFLIVNPSNIRCFYKGANANQSGCYCLQPLLMVSKRALSNSFMTTQGMTFQPQGRHLLGACFGGGRPSIVGDVRRAIKAPAVCVCVCSSADTSDQMTPFRRSCSNSGVETTRDETTKEKRPASARRSLRAQRQRDVSADSSADGAVARCVARPRRRSEPPNCRCYCWALVSRSRLLLRAFHRLSRGPSKLHIQHPSEKHGLPVMPVR